MGSAICVVNKNDASSRVQSPSSRGDEKVCKEQPGRINSCLEESYVAAASRNVIRAAFIIA